MPSSESTCCSAASLRSTASVFDNFFAYLVFGAGGMFIGLSWMPRDPAWGCIVGMLAHAVISVMVCLAIAWGLSKLATNMEAKAQVRAEAAARDERVRSTPRVKNPQILFQLGATGTNTSQAIPSDSARVIDLDKLDDDETSKAFELGSVPASP